MHKLQLPWLAGCLQERSRAAGCADTLVGPKSSYLRVQRLDDSQAVELPAGLAIVEFVVDAVGTIYLHVLCLLSHQAGREGPLRRPGGVPKHQVHVVVYLRFEGGVVGSTPR